MKPAHLLLLLPIVALAGDTPAPAPAGITTPRYQLLSAPLTAAGDSTDLQLQVILRLDTATGRTWRLTALSGTATDTNTLRWIPISDPNPPAPNPTQTSQTPTNTPPAPYTHSYETPFTLAIGFA